MSNLNNFKHLKHYYKSKRGCKVVEALEMSPQINLHILQHLQWNTSILIMIDKQF